METCCHSHSSERPSANAYVKNSQVVNNNNNNNNSNNNNNNTQKIANVRCAVTEMKPTITL